MVLGYALLIEPNRIEIKHIEIKDSAFNYTLKGKTAVHLSDLHITKIGKKEKEILRILDALKPDFLFLTGDYVKFKGDYGGALGFLSKLDAPMGVWAVMGDYDYSSSRKSCLFCHEKGTGVLTGQHKIKFLRNKTEPLSLSNGTIYIGGIEYKAGENDIFVNTYCRGEKAPALILCHNPLLFDAIEENCEVLILAGDTHGGQIPLPRWIWNIIGYEKNALYNQGIFCKGRKIMYVNRGIGTSHLPFRFLRTPELVVLHF
jgi:hypothetical protein